MKRYILTGAPGCGKTSIIRALEMRDKSVVAESATDLKISPNEQTEIAINPLQCYRKIFLGCSLLGS